MNNFGVGGLLVISLALVITGCASTQPDSVRTQLVETRVVLDDGEPTASVVRRPRPTRMPLYMPSLRKPKAWFTGRVWAHPPNRLLRQRPG